MRSLKVINDRSTLCTPLTHQSVITRLATMTPVCFLPSHLPSPPHHCNQHPFAPSCIFVSFISSHMIVTVSKSSHHLQRGETTFGSVCSLSFRLSLQKMLSLSNFSSDRIVSQCDSSLLSHSFSLHTSSHVQCVTRQMWHTTVDEQ